MAGDGELKGGAFDVQEGRSSEENYNSLEGTANERQGNETILNAIPSV
jgi:hypothetical protein